MNTMKHAIAIVRIDAKLYEDFDDCLTAAAADYAERHGLQGWDLAPRYEDQGTREVILLTVPESDA